MRLALRVLAVVAVFVAVGVFTARTVLAHQANAGIYQPQVRLGADMAGLFAGGFAALLTIILIVRLSRR